MCSWVVDISPHGCSVTMAKKKQVSKKKAETGRPVKCRQCTRDMKPQGNLFGQHDYICENCGFVWTQVDPAKWMGEHAV